MKTAKVPSLLLALVLQLLPVTRIFLATPAVTGSSLAVVPAWLGALAALMGGYNAVSGASTRITSSATAKGTNGVPFSYRITVGPQSANRFSAVPLPTGLACSISSGQITGIPTQTGVFNVLLTASDGGRASRTVTKTLVLTILPNQNGSGPPSIITQPTNQTGTVGGSVTLTVVAAGPGPLSYQWQHGGIAVSGGNSSSLTLASLTANHAGSYKVVVNNSRGSVTSAVAIVTVNPAPVAPRISTQPVSITVMSGSNATFGVAATGTAPLHYQWQKGGVVVAGATNATLSLAAAIARDAGNYTVVVTNQFGSVTSSVATLTVTNRFIPLKGNYTGLFYPNAPEPPLEQSGQFALTVTDQGAFSGKLLLAEGSYSVSGQLDLSLAGTKTIPRKGTNEIVLHVQLHEGSEQVSGYVSNANWTSDLFGYRMTYDARLNPATNQSGNYTMLLSGGGDAALSPAGLSPATLDITTAGTMTLKVTLADGTAVVQKTSLAANGQAPVYATLYKGGGSLIGWLNVTNTATNDIPGLLVWTKKNGAPGKLYPGGFTNEMLALASRYTPPATGTAVTGLSNPVIILEGGNLTGPMTNAASLSSLNKISVTSPNTSKLVLTVKSASGVLSGTFVHPQTSKKSTIKGVVLQKQNLGGGFFLGTDQSGSVFLGQPEDAPVFAP